MPAPARLALCLTALTLACSASGDDTGGATTTAPGATTDDPAVTTSTTGVGPTTVDDPTTTAAATTTPSDPSTTQPDPATDTVADTGSDTDAPGLACPIDAQDGLVVLDLAPALFTAGADPSSDPVCQIANPERGFFDFTSLRDLDDDTLDDVSAAGRTLIYGQVLIPEFVDGPLDDALLAQVSDALDRVRAHGLKVVPRFHYSNDVGEADADLDRVLGHIDQLAPLLQQHADVIFTLQAGFIGAYGEWHSSTNGLDDPAPRKAILDALLAALPAHRTVGVRRPSFKDDAYGGPLTADTAHDGSERARVGHINDCFLASEDDYGTYQEPGEKDYAIADTAHVAVGGETCGVNPPRSECPSALDELALLHWTYLNADYHPDVLDSWQADGCYAQIACRLGYRLALTRLVHAASATPGGVLPVALDLVNDGFAAPVNARPLQLVFDGPTRFTADVELDVRDLQPGVPQSVCVDVAVPADAPPGAYAIGLALPDPDLADDPRQAVRLANDADVEWSEGVNWPTASVTLE